MAEAFSLTTLCLSYTNIESKRVWAHFDKNVDATFESLNQILNLKNNSPSHGFSVLTFWLKGTDSTNEGTGCARLLIKTILL